MKKIERLTPEQQADLPVFRKRWLDVGLSTEPANFAAATEVIGDFYQRIGKPRPMFMSFSSPMMCALAYDAIKILLKNAGGAKPPPKKLRGQLGDQLGGQLHGQLRDQLHGQLRGQLGGQLGDQLGGQLHGQLRDQLGDQLHGQLGGQLHGQLHGQLRDQLHGQLRGQLGDQLGGQLHGQLRDQLHGQLRGQLGGQLGDQLGGQLHGQLRDQLGDQLHGQLGGQLHGQLRGQLRDQLHGQLRGQLGDQLGGQLHGQLRDQLHGQLRGQLGDQLRGQLGGQLGGQLRDQLGGQLHGQLRDQLHGQLRDQLGDQLRGQLGGQLRDQLGGQLHGQKLFDEVFGGLYNYWTFGGQHTAYWIAYYSFAAKIGVDYGADNLRLLEMWAKLAESACWWQPFDGLCLISDRPRVVSFDAERRLHSETGPAIGFSDGWGVHAWHGQRIPAEWIENKPSLTAKIALTWPNIEQRRVACEILGWHSILEELKAKTIDRDPEPEIGELVEVTIPEVGKERFLRVRCGTGRAFALPVPPTMKTALQANAWTYGIDDAAKFVKPEVRT